MNYVLYYGRYSPGVPAQHMGRATLGIHDTHRALCVHTAVVTTAELRTLSAQAAAHARVIRLRLADRKVLQTPAGTVGPLERGFSEIVNERH
jgi:hypothetical protein